MYQITILCTACNERIVVNEALEGSLDVKCPVCQRPVLQIKNLAGFIYILSNESMPGVVKIGFTSRTVAERVAELSAATGVAAPFKAEASFPVADPIDVERIIHNGLCQHRFSQNREFFRLPPDKAISEVHKILGLSDPPKGRKLKAKRKPRVKESFPVAPESSQTQMANELRNRGVILGGFGSSRHKR